MPAFQCLSPLYEEVGHVAYFTRTGHKAALLGHGAARGASSSLEALLHGNWQRAERPPPYMPDVTRPEDSCMCAWLCTFIHSFTRASVHDAARLCTLGKLPSASLQDSFIL